MVRGNLYGPPSETLVVLLDDELAHDFEGAEQLLGSICDQCAVWRCSGHGRTIHEIVLHCSANIAFNLDLILGTKELELYDSEWPDAVLRSWERDRDKLLSLLRETISCAREQDLSRMLFEANEEEPGWSVGYKLAASVAKHQAYHMGQIAFIRDAYLSKKNSLI
jgi:hypothetical protein